MAAVTFRQVSEVWLLNVGKVLSENKLHLNDLWILIETYALFKQRPTS